MSDSHGADEAHGAGRPPLRASADHEATESFRMTLRLPADPAEVARARQAVRELAERAGLSPSRCADVALAVGEICSNVVLHAYRGSGEGSFVLDASGRDGRLEVRVSDDGCGLSPRLDSPGAGYGLPLVAAITSSLELQAAPGGGTEVRMAFSGATPGGVA